jgi:hypothetical protein
MPDRKSPVTPRYSWNERAGRYRDTKTGRYVSQTTLRNELEKVARQGKANMRALGEQLRSREISLAEWQLRMAQEVKSVHVAQAAAARGGWAQMSQSDWGYTGAQIRKQYEYLQHFADQVASGQQPLNGQVAARCGMYGDAGHTTHEKMRGRYMANSMSMEEERRVLTASESCQGCIEEAGRGWVPLGTSAPIGSKECRANCKCYKEYRRVNADGSYSVMQ